MERFVVFHKCIVRVLSISGYIFAIWILLVTLIYATDLSHVLLGKRHVDQLKLSFAICLGWLVLKCLESLLNNHVLIFFHLWGEETFLL